MTPLEKLQRLDQELVSLSIKQGKVIHRRRLLAETLRGNPDFQVYHQNFIEALSPMNTLSKGGES